MDTLNKRTQLSPKKKQQLFQKYNQLKSILGIDIQGKISQGKQIVKNQDLTVIKQVERSIIDNAIKNAQKASLETGYTDFHLDCELASQCLSDAYSLECIANQSCLKNKEVLTSAKDAIDSFSTQKSIKILRNGLVKGDYSNGRNSN